MSNQAGMRKGKGLPLQNWGAENKTRKTIYLRAKRTQEVEYHGEKANTAFKLGLGSAR